MLAKVKLLHIAYKHWENSISPCLYHLVNPLDETQLASQKLIFVDNFIKLIKDKKIYEIQNHEIQLVRYLIKNPPHAVMLCSWWFDYPSKEILIYIRKKLNIPIVAFWWDTCWKGFYKEIHPMLPYIDINIVLDNPNLYFIIDKPFFHKFVYMISQYDQNIFYNKETDRDIPVFFSGQIGGYRDHRSGYIDYIKNRVSGLFLTENKSKQPELPEYVKLLNRTKIGINFSYSHDCHQLKGRVFEIMRCGAMLMENENDQISRLFIPMVDYVPFSTKEDLLQKIHFYIHNDDERCRIAANGYKKAMKYSNSHNVFWTNIIERISGIRKISGYKDFETDC